MRQRPYVVTGIQRSSMPAHATIHDDISSQHLVTLSSVEDEGLGEELNVVWELEPGVACLEKTQLPELKSFDPPRQFDAFLDAVAWGAVSQADDKALQAPFRSGVEVDDYQLDPVVRALSMPRVNLLIADDVGLGKTIEAGLVAQELMLRHRVRSVLIVCPSSIQIQWQEEMRDKFGLEFRVVDSDLFRDLRRRRGIHANPWTHFPRLITSIDFIKRERPLRLFRETLPAGDQPAYPRRFDLIIVDEAHNIAPSGRGKYATDSLRTTAIRMMVPHFEHRLFLSATPHNGYSESFSALLELLDNQRFARAIIPNRSQLEAVMIRRMKSELELRWDGSRRFAERKVKCLEVEYSKQEIQAHKNLQEYSKLRHKTINTAGEKFATEFVLKLLKKRLFSSPAAFALTLEKHVNSIGLTSGQDISKANIKQIEAVDDDYANDEEYEETALDALKTASRHITPLSVEEKELLKQLRTYASQAASYADSKTRALIKWLKDNIKPNDKWSDRRVIIFTEYRATQKYLHDLLAAEGLAGEDRLKTIYGGIKLDDREKIKAAFQTHPNESPVRILLATDAASEGINLQNYCWQMIHCEIPWNPNRMEQRNGRIDRHGQKNSEVHIYHFVGEGFEKTQPGQAPGDLKGDLEFLLRAALKVENIREDLGKVGPVIAAQVEEAMLGYRKILDTSHAEKESEPIKRMLKFERKLREQLEKLSSQLQETKNDLRLSPENIQNVIEVGLDLAGQPPLRPAEVSGIWPDQTGQRQNCPVFYLPGLTGSWAMCADGLAHPHTNVVRPIVFDHNLATGRDDVVLCHLNHRLVQMCLRLLRAEIWSQGLAKKLSRYTIRMVPDSALQSPAVIAHGRLLVLGGDNQRIHEEIIQAGGRIREGRFSRFNVGDTKAAYNAAIDDVPPPVVGETIKQLWPKIQDSVFQALEARMRERTKNLESFLDDRVEREIGNIKNIMGELERSILETLQEKHDPQLYFDWVDSEMQQHERDLNSLRIRLSQIPEELNHEIEHLREHYRDPHPRLFPVAVTFLIPPRAVSQLRQGGAI